MVAALGMFVETASIAAANRGLRLEVQPADLETVRAAARGHGTGLVPAARLTLGTGGAPVREFSDELVRARRTSRLSPSPAPIPPADLDAVAATVRHCDQTIHLIEEPAVVEELMRVNLDAVVADLNTPSYHDEIVRWFRYTKDQEERTRDGLSARCMVMPGFEMAFLARFPGVARWPVVGALARTLYRRRIGSVQRLLAVAGPFWNGPYAFGAGRALMRIWLELTRRGLSVHPFGNLVTNAAAVEELKRLTGISDPWIVMRVGSTERPPRSLRRRFTDVVAGLDADEESSAYREPSAAEGSSADDD